MLSVIIDTTLEQLEKKCVWVLKYQGPGHNMMGVIFLYSFL